MKRYWRLVGIVAFVCLWQTIHFIKNDPTIVSADKILFAFGKILSDHKFYVHLFSTLRIVTAGIIASIIGGVSLGILVSLSQKTEDLVMPLLTLFRNIPSITLFPILIAMYGISDLPRIIVIVWTVLPSVILSTIHGIKSIDKSIIEASEVGGANKLQIMFHIETFLAMPMILNGIKIGIGNGFIAIVVAEMLGASKGLGFMVLWNTNTFKYAETYAYMLIIALVGGFFNVVMNMITKEYERRYL